MDISFSPSSLLRNLSTVNTDFAVDRGVHIQRERKFWEPDLYARASDFAFLLSAP